VLREECDERGIDGADTSCARAASPPAQLGRPTLVPNAAKVCLLPPPIQGMFNVVLQPTVFLRFLNVEDEYRRRSEDFDDYDCASRGSQLDGLKIRRTAALRRSLYAADHTPCRRGACARVRSATGHDGRPRVPATTGRERRQFAYVLVGGARCTGMVHGAQRDGTGREDERIDVGPARSPADFEAVGMGRSKRPE